MRADGLLRTFLANVEQLSCETVSGGGKEEPWVRAEGTTAFESGRCEESEGVQARESHHSGPAPPAAHVPGASRGAGDGEAAGSSDESGGWEAEELVEESQHNERGGPGWI
eukprot:755529-Hanusia_phi.AAC.4